MTKIFLLLGLLFLATSGFVHGSYEKKDQIRLFELKKGDLSIKVTNWGATLVSLILPDKNGTYTCFFFEFKPFINFSFCFLAF